MSGMFAADSDSSRFVTVSPGSVALAREPSGARRPGPDDVRATVLACGICGTDLHLWHGMRLPPGAAYPVRPGHEVCGRVLEVGSAVGRGVDADAPRVGDLVVLHPVASCGVCPLCAQGRDQLCQQGRILGIHEPGGLADEVIWPASRTVVVDGIAPTAAAVLADAVATAYRAVRIADIAPEAVVCVLGAGGVGTHVLELMRALTPRATLVGVTGTERSAERLHSAGFDAVVAGDDLVKRLRASHGSFDTVVEFSGAPAAPAQAVRLLRPGGTLLFGSVVDGPLALGPAVALQSRELVVRGVYSSSLADLRDVVDLASAGRIDLSGSVTHTVSLDDAPDAFRTLDARPAGLVRMVVTTGAAGE
ncbi:alcohol dehydrogenase catalytic domain-containing protein [Pseudonocardia sp. CA-107938]|uniref:alcohol dehydrogenase catalytic domain-containing protein n=1 Tax=Pseudonocardia sp. CA-107938 TaxID=3240021 RepID=UPI003D923219